MVIVVFTAGSKYLEYNLGSGLNLFSLNNETMNNENQKNRTKTKVEQRVNENQIVEQNNEQ
jgi:hypothetical protein